MRARRAGRASPVHPARLRLPSALVRLGLREFSRRVLDPGVPWEVQRRRVDQIMRASPVPRGTTVTTSVRTPSAPPSTSTAAAIASARR